MLMRLLGWFGVNAITAKVKAILLGVTLALGLSVLVGAYAKGRMDCAANVELANAKAAIAKLIAERDLMLEMLELATKQSNEFEDQERTNDEIGPALDDPSPTPCGLDAGWLSKLSKLR